MGRPAGRPRRTTTPGPGGRCTLTAAAATAIVESVEVEEIDGWAIGVDILLEDVEPEPELATVSPIRIAS